MQESLPPPPFSRETILIIDDQASVVLMLREVVSRMGNVFFSTSGLGAYAAALKLRPDLIILDIQMPELNGFELCDLLRQEGSLADTPIIFITASEDPACEEKAFQCGGSDFIRKPLDARTLQARIRHQLARSRQTRIARENREKLVALQRVMDACPEITVAVDRRGIITHLRGSDSRILNGHCIGMHVDDALSLRDSTLASPVENPVFAAMRNGQKYSGSENLCVKFQDGTCLEVDARAFPISAPPDEVLGAVLLLVDATESRATQRQLRYLANHDALTNLPNRMSFEQFSISAVSMASRNHSTVAMFVINIDSFKKINESFGHSTGDKILREVTRRLTCFKAGKDMLCRNGADEFLLLNAESSPETARITAAEILNSIAVPLLLDGIRYDITTSVGAALYPDDSLNSDAIYHHAHSAIYQAKREGGNRVHFYSAEEERLNQARNVMERRLRVASELSLFELFYQPKVDGREDRVVGAEALLRLRDESGTIIPPASFIPLAEETGLIIPIGTWVMEQAFTHAGQWHRQGYDIRVSVNISASQFQEDNFYEIVKLALDRSGAKPSLVELEITEGVLARQTERSSEVLSRLKSTGIQISLDDFGTGYSSLSYLKKFPIDVIKIDQSFVRDMLTDPSDAAIVQAVVKIAQSMSLRLVAEGVESRQHVDALLAQGCHIMQGYYYSRPMPHQNMCEYLKHSYFPA